MTTHAQLETLREEHVGETFKSADRCPICGHKSVVTDTATTIHPNRPVPFDLRRCDDCRHLWIDPMPQQDFLNHLYECASNSVIGVGWETEKRDTLTVPEQQTFDQESSHPAGRYFELGVGMGLLYSRFNGLGWKCSGVEPGGWGHHLPGVVPSLADLPRGSQFDVLVAIDVLEHVTDPIDMLTSLTALAAPGARIYAGFPNSESFRSRIQKAAWRMVRPLGHVHYFSRSSTKRMFASAGLTITTMNKSDLATRPTWSDPRSLLFAGVQLAQLGDQWFVAAKAAGRNRG